MRMVIPFLGIFIMSVLIIELLSYAYRTLRDPNRKKFRKRIKMLASHGYGNDPVDITRKRLLSDIPSLNRILLHTPGVRSLDRLLQQANVHFTLGVFILFTTVLALTGYAGSTLITKSGLTSYIIGASLVVIPFLLLKRKKKKRIQKFERQLPDGLDLMARALRAGHAFTSGMRLAADEFDDPLGPEFEATLEEINFGVSVSDALKNLASRIDCPDLRFFVVSTILQRDTGGNLAEIIESIAHVIRERYKLRGKIRVLSAEGKLSAVILIAIPLVIVLVLRLMNPEYITPLLTTPEGRVLMGLAVFMMVIGIFVIKRMIAIKV